MVTIPLLVSFHSRSFAPRLPNAASSWEALNYIESGYGTTQSFRDISSRDRKTREPFTPCDTLGRS